MAPDLQEPPLREPPLYFREFIDIDGWPAFVRENILRERMYFAQRYWEGRLGRPLRRKVSDIERRGDRLVSEMVLVDADFHSGEPDV